MRLLIPIVAVALGGAGGAVLRHLIAEVVRVATAWPGYVATLLSNVVGCFGIGLAFVLLENASLPSWMKPFLVTGLLGAFTTFSTFSLEAMELIHEGRYGELLAYVAASVGLGLICVKAGMLVAG